MRQKFACCDDVLILRCVKQNKPWEEECGKTMKIWDDIAGALAKNPLFINNKKTNAIKVRYELLIRTSIRKSRDVEEFNEREQILNVITSRLDDWKRMAQQQNRRKL